MSRSRSLPGLAPAGWAFSSRTARTVRPVVVVTFPMVLMMTS
jgi:hypothetical protein